MNKTIIAKEELIKFVKDRSWYQTIKFEDDVISNGGSWYGEMAWQSIAKFLPKSLEGKRVLDLGCNAGLFCVNTALMGAKEVIGIDWPGWSPDIDFQEQQKFVTSYFSQKYNKTLPIKYMPGKMEEILRNTDLGIFDYTLAIASIYYARYQEEIVDLISKVSNNVIVRLRDESKIKLFTGLFKHAGYKEVKSLREECWKDSIISPDGYYLYLYSK